jgi:uncharacterized membrane protein
LDLVAARIIHVLAIVHWIGGVAFVTTVLTPWVRRRESPERRLAVFLQFEAGFAAQARISVAVAGLSGFYLTWRLDAWARFASPTYWWMHAMLGLWLVFAVMLFVLEPFVLHRRLEHAIAAGASDRVFRRVERFHKVMLTLSALTILGAVGGSHGLFV